jgi:hypothetical protein
VLKDRAIIIGTLFATFAVALAACSSGTTPSVPPASSANAAPVSASNSSATTSIPGHGEYDVSAHYVVFKQVWDTPAIVVIGVQVADDYLKAFPTSTRLDGATIVYPDGSKQVTSAQGEFDAGMSSYAQAHPEKIDGTDITVRVEAPATESLKAITTTIFAPSESEEKHIDSGVIPPGAKPSESPRPDAIVRPDGYIWSCNPQDYHFKQLTVAVPGWSYDSSIITFKGTWYEPHFYVCGTDQPTDAVKWHAVSWRDLNGVYDVWSANFEFKPGYGGQRIAVWWSPSLYLVEHRNVHEQLFELQQQ